jgi:hypothetical protein
MLGGHATSNVTIDATSDSLVQRDDLPPVIRPRRGYGYVIVSSWPQKRGRPRRTAPPVG